jgi:N-methylhydantoinase A
MDRYLEKLERELNTVGVSVPPYITKSNGGVTTARNARDATAETLLSGPASGVIGASYVCHLAGFDDLITLDMGGTSADIALVRGGRPAYSSDEHVGDFPVVMPAVGVSSIGAGGGSIAWIDRVGVLKVGPHSAGADPGPACYGRGGTEPALSDAFLICGFLNPDNFVGGRLRLDPDAAVAAMRPIAAALDLSVDDAAEAVIEVSTSNMYAEFSQVMARHGLDPREFTLVAFGGAGPIQACFLAAEFHIPRVLVPLAPGTLCALGALSADVKNDYVKTVNLKLSRTGVDELREHFAELRRRADEWLKHEGPRVLDRQIFYSADVRYEHQSYEIELAIDPDWLDAPDTGPIVEAFHRLHNQLYAHADPSGQIELISVHVKVVGTTPKPTTHPLATGSGAAAPSSSREIHYRGGRYLAAVYQRSDLLANQTLAGPAVVEQDDATVLIPDGFVGHVDTYGNLVITTATEGVLPTPELVGAGARREG